MTDTDRNWSEIEVSDEVDKILPALIEAEANFDRVLKDRMAKIRHRTGGEHEYDYFDLNDLYSGCKKALLEKRILIVHGAEVANGNGSIVVRVRTALLHESGQYIATTMPMVAESAHPQAIGSAKTYGKRYSLADLLAVAGEPDDDGAGAQKPNGQHDKQPQQPPPPHAESSQYKEFLKWANNLVNTSDVLNSLKDDVWPFVKPIAQARGMNGDQVRQHNANDDFFAKCREAVEAEVNRRTQAQPQAQPPEQPGQPQHQPETETI